MNRRIFSAAHALFALLLVTILVSCSSDAGDDGSSVPARPAPFEVRLGVVQSLTGAGGIYGDSVVRGIELAVEQLNRTPNAPFHISTTVIDDKSTVDGGMAAFTSLVQSKVTAVIGPTLSNVAIDGHKITQQAGIPTLGATTTAFGITATGDYIFRIALAEDVVVPVTLKFVAGQTPLRQTVLVLDSTDAFSRGSADAMRKGLSVIGSPAAREIDVSRTPDVLAQVRALADEQIDGFLITPLIGQSAVIVKELRAAGFLQTIVGGNSFNTLDIVPQSGGAVDRAYVGAAWNPDVPSPASRTFVDDYTKAYGKAPDLYAGQGYASLQVLADALMRAGTSEPKALRDALAASNDVQTVLGVLSFSAGRDAVHAPVVQQFRDGKLAVVQ